MKLDLTIKTKLIATLGILVAIILLSGFNADRSAKKQRIQMDIVNHLTKADVALYIARLAQADYIITQGSDFTLKFNQNILLAIEELKISQSFMAIDENIQRINQIISSTNKFNQAFDAYVRAQQEKVTNLQQYIDDILQTAGHASGEINLLIADEIVISEEVESDVFFVNQIIYVGSVILSLVLGVYLFKSIINPLNNSLSIANNIAAGVLNFKRPKISNDEFGVLNKALNSCADSLRNSASEIQNSATTLYDNSTNLSNSLHLAEENIKSQLMNIDMVVTAVEQSSTSTKEISNFASKSAEESNNASIALENGRKIVDDALVSVEQLSTSIKQSQTKIKTLDTRLSDIFNVLSSIKDISEQTNLLALNAAIEAARAGEQGRGFAVVADEVRALSVRTQDSLEQATSIISEINKGSHEVVEAISHATAITVNVQQLTNDSGDTYQNISEVIDNMCEYNLQVATATEEQTSVVEEINSNLNQIHDVASSNSEMMENVSKVFESQIELASNLKQMTKHYQL